MELKLSGDMILKITRQPSGIPDYETITLSQCFPMAQSPRYETIMQLTVTRAQALAIADAIDL